MNKQKKCAGLPPLASPRVTMVCPTMKGTTLRSMSQKLKTQMEKVEDTNRPATENIQKKNQIMRPLQSIRQSVKEVVVKKKVLTKKKEMPNQKSLKFQNPVINMNFMEYIEDLPQEEIIKDEILKEESQILEKRLITVKNQSLSSSQLQSSSGSQKQYICSSSDNQLSFQLDNSSNLSFVEGQFISSGSFGQVFQAQENKTGVIYAVKKINLKAQFDEEDLKNLQGEITLMQKLKHQNIVRYIHSEKTQDYQLIYLEYMSQGNLNQLTSKYGPLQIRTISNYSKQILEALKYLHELQIIHRDVKGANILVDSNGNIKLSDFGCSKIKDKTLTLIKSNNSEQNILSSLKGSIPYMSPEVVQQDKISYSADIWSFGCTVLEMATGKRPWHEYDFDNLLTAIITIGVGDNIPSIPEDLDPLLQDMLKQCLQRDANLRPSAQDLLNHKLIQQYCLY